MYRLLAYPRAILLLLFLFVVAIGHRAFFIPQDNSPEVFFSADHEAREVYHDMIEAFGADEFVVVELFGARADVPRDVKAVDQLARSISGLTTVKEVISPIQMDLQLSEDPEDLPDEDQLEAIHRELETVPLYRNVGVYRPEIPAMGVVALLSKQDPESRPKINRELNEVVARFRAEGFEPVAAGLATANATMDREMKRSVREFFPLVAVFCLLIGVWLFRSAKALVAVFLPVLGAVVAGVGGLELAGETLNMVSSVMPPLVFAVGFAGAIHLITHYSAGRDKGLPHTDALQQTVREKFVPTAFAYGTTAVGFGSLALSEVPAVRVLGIASSATLLAAIIIVVLGTSALIHVLEPDLKASPRRRGLLERGATFAGKRRGMILLLSSLALLFVATGVSRLESTVDGMELISEDLPESIAFHRLERAGIAMGNVDVWIHVPTPDSEALLREARRLEEMARELEKESVVTGVVGVHSLLEAVGQRMNGQAKIPMFMPLSGLMGSERSKELEQRLSLFRHPERGLKLTLLTHTGQEAPVLALQKRAREVAARVFPGIQVDVSGHYSMLVGTPGLLIRTLSSSLTLTVLIVCGLFLLFFRSFFLVGVAMAVNLLPVGLAMGLMGWLGIPLDVVTVMMGSVAFGIAVDDTFHYLYHRQKTGNLLRAAQITGEGIVATSIVIVGGFLVLSFSGFVPVQRFGFFTALAVAVALVVDALVLPALVGGSEENGASVET